MIKHPTCRAIALTRKLYHWCAAVLWLILAGTAAAPALAHDPFDGGALMVVYGDKIEVKLTLGYDAAREFLRAAHLPAVDVSRITRDRPDHTPVTLPASLAPGLFTLTAQNQAVAATALLAYPGQDETVFLIIFPRPAVDIVQLRAPYFDTIAYMRPGPLVIADRQHIMLGSTLLSKASPGVEASLTRQTPNGYRPPAIGAAGFFTLGVEHILTGFDHLLFLGALLITMRRIGPMLGIVSAFTLAHSVTLALAALGLATVRSSIVEPLIAVSIMVVCIENFLRREATSDRYWMAGVFGLIHGFGFAGILRETALAQPGTAIVVPLLSFNLGVETGQLMVAAVVVPLLLLARRKPVLLRYGVPAVSGLITLVSAYWLWERLLGGSA